jgi:hypothetical protein
MNYPEPHFYKTEAGGLAYHLPGNITLFHNENGPAIWQPRGSMEWWINGNRHRSDGPAIINPVDKTEAWWLNGEHWDVQDLHEWPLALYMAYLRWIKLESKPVHIREH